jgi:hypothetical protein
MFMKKYLEKYEWQTSDERSGQRAAVCEGGGVS